MIMPLAWPDDVAAGQRLLELGFAARSIQHQSGCAWRRSTQPAGLPVEGTRSFGEHVQRAPSTYRSRIAGTP